MKIRIKGNTIRFRLTKSEVQRLCSTGHIEDKTEFLNQDFVYAVELSKKHDTQSVSFHDNKIICYLPYNIGHDWYNTNEVGFENIQELTKNKTLFILLEKDFACLDNRLEDQSDNYPNPKSPEA